jgi:N-methylhydantoinase A
VELVNLRVRLTAPARAPALPTVQAIAASDGAVVRPEARVRVAGCAGEVPLYRRASLPVGVPLAGPGVILDAVATTWLAPGWRAQRDRFGNLLLRSGED